jgi:hypothetical protein
MVATKPTEIVEVWHLSQITNNIYMLSAFILLIHLVNFVKLWVSEKIYLHLKIGK